ncbi:MAG: hypothetical protein AB7E49_06450 [Campylobacterales bacterium]
MTAGDALQWIAVAVILIVFYRKIIAPFANRMLQIPTEEPIEEKSRIVFDDDEIDDLPDNSADLRRRVEQRLKVSDSDQMERLKYETLLEKLREQSENAPGEVGSVITSLTHGLDKLEAEFNKGKKSGNS